MKRSRTFVILACLAVASAAVALTAGQKVFIRAKNTKVFKKPDLADTASVETLQPGQEVVWQKKENDQFHEILTPAGKKGYVFFANLSLRKPESEFLRAQGDKPVDPKAFASSGAATKALAPGPIAYGEQKVENGAAAVANVLAMEAIAKSVSNNELKEFGDKRGVVAPVVAPVKGASK